MNKNSDVVAGNVFNDFKDVLDYQPGEDPVISCYLMVDGARTNRKDYLTELNSLITASRDKIENNKDLSKNQKKKNGDLLEKIKNFVNDKFIADSTRTLVIFASGNTLWKIFRLPIIMKSKVIIDPKPYTQNIRSFINNSKKYGVLLIDREKGQIYSVYLGEINEYLAAFISDVPSKVNLRSQAVLREKKILARMEEKLHQFFKFINERAFELFKDNKFDYLILAGRKEILPGFNNYLHSYLQSKTIGTIEAEPDSSILVIKGKAKKLIDDFENNIKNQLVDRLIDEYNSNNIGVLGINGTIKALLKDQVKILVYDKNFMQEGFICSGCRFISVDRKETCPYCAGELIPYNDIVDEIVEDALNQGCEIVDVENNRRLTDAGNIGAVLRYKWQ